MSIIFIHISSIEWIYWIWNSDFFFYCWNSLNWFLYFISMFNKMLNKWGKVYIGEDITITHNMEIEIKKKKSWHCKHILEMSDIFKEYMDAQTKWRRKTFHDDFILIFMNFFNNFFNSIYCDFNSQLSFCTIRNDINCFIWICISKSLSITNHAFVEFLVFNVFQIKFWRILHAFIKMFLQLLLTSSIFNFFKK